MKVYIAYEIEHGYDPEETEARVIGVFTSEAQALAHGSMVIERELDVAHKRVFLIKMLPSGTLKVFDRGYRADDGSFGKIIYKSPKEAGGYPTLVFAYEGEDDSEIAKAEFQAEYDIWIHSGARGVKTWKKAQARVKELAERLGGKA